MIRFANQVHRSPSPRSLATACFLWPRGDCPRTKTHGRIPRLIRLKFELVPARSRRLFVRLSLLISTCLTSETHRCAKLASACSPFNAFATKKDHKQRADREPAHLSPQTRSKQRLACCNDITMSGAQYASSGRGVSEISTLEAHSLPHPRPQEHLEIGGQSCWARSIL